MTDIYIMQEFFKSELKTLAIKTGLEQAEVIYKNASTVQEAKAILDEVTLQWATCTCTSPFDKITPDVKKRIIQDQMIKDESFSKPHYGHVPGFNNRILWKWLNNHWQIHGDKIEKKTEQAKPENIAPPEVADKYLNQLKQSLISVKPEYPDLHRDIEKIKQEDKERQEGPRQHNHKSSEEYYRRFEKMRQVAKNRGLDKLDFKDLNQFNVEGQTIIARSIQEAEEIFLEVWCTGLR
jgi:F0F1-type ATP synthase membrane subunit b/b'